jgi:hypothetical protein
VLRALEESHWNRQEAAQRLDMHRFDVMEKNEGVWASMSLDAADHAVSSFFRTTTPT